jgi:hypothetical protein
MGLGFRHTLIGFTAFAWLAATVLLLPGDLTSFEQLTWFAFLFAAMVVVDRIYVAIVRRRHGVDPMTLHWSKLRNRKGEFFCAACRSIFLLPPEDFSDSGWVRCGDCGHAVAPYGEMKPFLLGHRRARPP